MGAWTATTTPTAEHLCHALSTSVSPADGGDTGVNTGWTLSGGRFTAGTRVSLTANRSCEKHNWPGGCRERYDLDYWSGDASGGNRNINITMNRNVAVTAHFE